MAFAMMNQRVEVGTYRGRHLAAQRSSDTVGQRSGDTIGQRSSGGRSPWGGAQER